MIHTKEKHIQLIIPKLDKCNVACSGVYQLIIQNTYTKEAWMYKVRDFSLGNKLRYEINFEFMDEMDTGTYQYYLLPDGEWSTDQINVNDVRETSEMILNDALCVNGSYLVACGKLLVVGQYEAALTEGCNQIVQEDGSFLSVTMRINDQAPEGEIYPRIKIIATGLIKYERFTLLKDGPQEFNDQKTFIEFKG